MCNKCKNNSCDKCCEPKCDPCLKQQKIMYCGKDIECLDIEKGSDLNKVIKKIGDWVCTQINAPTADTYVNLVEIEPGEVCETGGVTIQVIEFSTDNLVEEYTICNPVPFELLTELNGGLVGSAETINIEEGEGVKIEADNNNDKTTYTFSTYFEVTYNEAEDLIANEALIKSATYLITDRGITVRALNEKEFELNATLKHPCPKTEYYERSGNNLGVYHPLIPTAGLLGKTVVYGAKVWENITDNIGSNINFLELDATNWVLKPLADEVFYEVKTLDIIYNFSDDFVSEYVDNRGNTLTTDIELATTISVGHSRFVCDWNMEYFNNNRVSGICLNNAGYETYDPNNLPIYLPIQISENIDTIILNNSCEIISRNSKGAIALNTVQTIGNTVVGSVIENKVTQIIGNIVKGNVSGNKNFTESKANTYINGNIVTGNISNNTISTEISRNRAGEDISDNTNCIITNNTFLRGVASNNKITITRSFLGNVVNNSNSYFAHCEITVNVQDNIDCMNISNIRTSSFESNSNITKMTSNIAEYILSNQDIQEISYNICQRGLEGNKNIRFILENRCLGIIDNDGLTYTDTEIVKNSCSGYIERNLLSNNNVKIEYNNNNGDIGTQSSDTVRTASVTGTVTNL